MSIYGYARISTAKQSIERQIRNIEREYPDAVIRREAYTGTKIDRKVSAPFENVDFRRNGVSFLTGQHTGVIQP